MDQTKFRHRYGMRITAVSTKLRVHSKLKAGELDQKKFIHTLPHTASFLSFNPSLTPRQF
jgi:hypothetical protein